jgi:hypothetical protein
MRRNYLMEQWMLLTLQQAHQAVGNDPVQSHIQISRQLEDLVGGQGYWPSDPDEHLKAVRSVIAEAHRVINKEIYRGKSEPRVRIPIKAAPRAKKQPSL